jgi:hypothetical protein
MSQRGPRGRGLGVYLTEHGPYYWGSNLPDTGLGLYVTEHGPYYWGSNLPQTGLGDGLGDFMCWDDDCWFGRDAVAQLNVYYEAADKPADFAAAVEDINRRLDNVGVHWPFSRFCCHLKDIGLDAQKVTQALAAAHKMPAPVVSEPTQSPTSEGLRVFGAIAKGLLILGGAGLAVWGGAVAYRSYQRRHGLAGYRRRR